MSYIVARVSHHHGPKKMSDAKIVPLIQSPLQGKQTCPIYPHSHQHYWTCSSKATIICHSCRGTILISRAILPLHLPCRGVGQDVGVRDEKWRVGADSYFAVFRISSARRLQTNPWRLLPYSGNTSFRQTDKKK